jgi:hypothetical protein
MCVVCVFMGGTGVHSLFDVQALYKGGFHPAIPRSLISFRQHSQPAPIKKQAPELAHDGNRPDQIYRSANQERRSFADRTSTENTSRRMTRFNS